MDIKKLKKIVDNSEIKKSYICKQMNITYAALNNKLKGKSPFMIDEIIVLARVLRLSQEDIISIFFTDEVV